MKLEEYLWYAEQSRNYEAGLTTDVGYKRAIKNLRHPKGATRKTNMMSVLKGKGAPKGRDHDRAVEAETKTYTESSQSGSGDEKIRTDSHPDEHSPASTGYPTDEEWFQASRAMRTATWGAVFYLITTDILGPYSVPWAMSQLGYGPGAVLYTVFAGLAF